MEREASDECELLYCGDVIANDSRGDVRRGSGSVAVFHQSRYANIGYLYLPVSLALVSPEFQRPVPKASKVLERIQRSWKSRSEAK